MRSIWHILLNRWAALLHDLLWIPAAIFAALWLRFNLAAIPSPFLHSAWALIVVALPIQGSIFWFAGLYRGFWRFASLPDLTRIVKAVLLGSAVIFFILFLLQRLSHVPRSLFLLYPILLTVGLTAPRIGYRWLKDHRLHLSPAEKKRAIILGAGQGADLLLRDLQRDQHLQPIGILDDDPTKQGRELHGVRVYGPINALENFAATLKVDIVLIAIPSATGPVIQRLATLCRRLNLPCQTLPSLTELTDNTVDARSLRPISLEDLLGREAIQLDLDAMAGYLQGKHVLVSGGGGSIGSELCRQIAELKPKILTIYEHSEYNLFTIEQELRRLFPALSLNPVLGDIKNQQRLRWLFTNKPPTIVFHAAAYKHVPMVENNPAEGVLNNVFGTITLARQAVRAGVEKFIMVSTDKAVNPTNVMGATKRIAEIYCQNIPQGDRATQFITTRFGNVLGSAGSVIPTFQKQIEEGGPVTVTHPEISRYFMTIPEAVSLILQAGAMGSGGEIFVLDMGKPILIRDLAEQMIRLSGREPGEDIAIIYTGLRPGEKLHEELFQAREKLTPTPHPKLLLAHSVEYPWPDLENGLAELHDAVTLRDVDQLRSLLQRLVPEYTPQP